MNSLPKIFMIGWEFPPNNAGGLGIACEGLTKALAKQHISQIFTLPKVLPIQTDYLEFASLDDPFFTQLHVNMKLYPSYGGMTKDQWNYLATKSALAGNSHNLIEQAYEYANLVSILSQKYDHDLIHGHDWFTYPAAIAAKKATGNPMLVHVHATEFDRTLAGSEDPRICRIEYEGLSNADKVIAVSEYTRQMVASKYQIPLSKIEVVHNGVDLQKQRSYYISNEELDLFARGHKIVVFVGRLTSQKGPDYFVKIAEKVSRAVPEALFVIAGSGDMYRQIVMQSGQSRLTGKLLFSGFLRDRQKEFLYRRADLFIMPSISEPFGIVPLEAAAAFTPVIISNQSGVKEVLHSAICADFWDTDYIAKKAIEVLTDPLYSYYLRENGAREVEQITWDRAASKCINVYQSLL
ncbi:glycosyltransferase family 4 protein [Candidatus Beckwithbacteria bacterium]|nr:glycosyltransferase family 4 protein [Candidatus Beckwithbacteria bacterium]